MRRLRVMTEHRLAGLTQLGIRQARCCARTKTKSQLYRAATVANLTLVSSKFWWTGNYGRHRHSLLTCIRGWLMSPTLPLSLFPNRTFRPTLLGSQERLGFAHRPGSRCIASLVFHFQLLVSRNSSQFLHIFMPKLKEE